MLTYDVIRAAQRYEAEAIRLILQHYSAYIDALVTDKSTGNYDVEARYRLEIKLIDSLAKFRT